MSIWPWSNPFPTRSGSLAFCTQCDVFPLIPLSVWRCESRVCEGRRQPHWWWLVIICSNGLYLKTRRPLFDVWRVILLEQRADLLAVDVIKVTRGFCFRKKNCRDQQWKRGIFFFYKNLWPTAQTKHLPNVLNPAVSGVHEVFTFVVYCICLESQLIMNNL